MHREKKFIPDKAHRKMLKACLCEGPEAVNAWEDWKTHVNLDLIDGESYKLMPLLYHHLQSRVKSDSVMEICKGIYRRSWYKNEMLSKKASAIIEALEQRGIPTLVLKGTPMLLNVYRNSGMRPMEDIDILVPPSRAFEAMKFIISLGWESVSKAPLRSILYRRHSAPFSRSKNEIIDLHWNTLWYCRQKDIDKEFWQASIPVEIHGVKTRALNPTDQLLHICAHGAMGPRSTALWAADACSILRSSGIDWRRFMREMQKRRLRLQMIHALSFIKEELHAPVPAGVINHMRSFPDTRLERIYAASIDYAWVSHEKLPHTMHHFFQNKKGRPRFKSKLLKLYDVRFQLFCGKYHLTLLDRLMKWTGFLKFSQIYYGVKTLRQVPLFLLDRLAAKWGMYFVPAPLRRVSSK